jgi:hypothetical protein
MRLHRSECERPAAEDSPRRNHPRLGKAEERLVDPATRGDPLSPLRWSFTSTAQLAEELCGPGYPISARTVADRLQEQDYRWQATRKTREGSSLQIGMPSFNTSMSRRFNPEERRWCRSTSRRKNGWAIIRTEAVNGLPKAVRRKDQCLISRTRRRARRLRRESTGQEGWVSVGTDPDTAEFAVQTIRCWWRQRGSKRIRRGGSC